MALTQIHNGISSPNGIDSWLIAFFEISEYLHATKYSVNYNACSIFQPGELHKLPVLAMNLANRFELDTAHIDWSEADKRTALDDFLTAFEWSNVNEFYP